MKQLTKIYESTTKENLDEIKNILKKCEMDKSLNIASYEKILSVSTDNVSKKWKSGRKYARTYFVAQAFGSHYPEKYLKFSMLFDAMVNILDDFFDEDLSKEEKGLYVLEFLRVFSLYNIYCPNIKIQKDTALYFNKLITLAIGENTYFNLIKKEKQIEKIVKYSADLLLCRAMDIDIFVEIALIEKNNKKEENLKKIAKIFRAINIFKKDIDDIEHDQKNNIETVTINVVNRNDQNFSEYTNKLLDFLISPIKEILDESKDYDKHLRMAIQGFDQLINEDIKKIKNNIYLK